MKYLFVAPLYQLEVSDYLGRGAKIAENLYVCNDSVKAKELLTEALLVGVGACEIQQLLSTKVYAYSTGDWPFPKDAEHSGKVLNRFLEILQALFTALWIVVDNSANTEQAFLELDYRAADALVTTNARMLRFSDSAGLFEVRRVTKQDLEGARDYLRTIPQEALNPFDLKQLWRGPDRTFDRISRTLYFLQAARSESFLPNKITFYCVCLETLVSTDTTELSHKVAERVSLLVGSDTNEKMEVYRIVKRAYGIRSQTVHGSSLGPDTTKVSHLSQACDNVLRRLMQKVYSDTEIFNALHASNTQIEDFFLRKLLGP